MEDFRLLCKLGAGTFSEVLKVKHRKTSKVYAMKRFRKHFNNFEEVEGLREIQALRRLNPHQNIVDLVDVVFDPKHGVLALNFELMECNLYELISRKGTTIPETRAKCIIYQLLRALEYMHAKGIFHRDIKPENILVKDNLIKLADFGSCRGIHSKPPYTEYIATRWYRSPECLICEGMYSYKMDIWGVGCVLFEILSKNPLFPGANQVDQLHRIHNTLGTPSPKLLKHILGSKANQPQYQFPQKEGTGIRQFIPHVSQECFDLIMQLLLYDPSDRLTAREALRHQFLREVPPDVGLASSSAAAGSRRDLRAADSTSARSLAKHASHVALHPHGDKKAADAAAVEGSQMGSPPAPGIKTNQEDNSKHAAASHQAKPLQHRQMGSIHNLNQPGASESTAALPAAAVGARAEAAHPAAKLLDAGHQQKPLARPPPAQIPPRRAEKEHVMEAAEAEAPSAQHKAAKRSKRERKPVIVKGTTQNRAHQLPLHAPHVIQQAQQVKGTLVGRNNPAAAPGKDPRKLPSLQAAQQNYGVTHQAEHNFSTRGQNFPALVNTQQQQQAATAMMLMMQSKTVMFSKPSYNICASKDQPVTLPSLMDRRHAGLAPSTHASATGVAANKHAAAQR